LHGVVFVIFCLGSVVNRPSKTRMNVLAEAEIDSASRLR
jgi:hypothetical protein